MKFITFRQQFDRLTFETFKFGAGHASHDRMVMVVIQELTASDEAAFAQCRHIRREVFCVEQRVPESIEWDAFDATCIHYLLLREGAAAATARTRLYAPGVWKIERVAVLKRLRQLGLGRDLMTHIIARARADGVREVILNAQTAVASFYSGLGFVAEGPEFLEADIPHMRMRMKLV
jgi:predicted GNAT family N-acyltransferase